MNVFKELDEKRGEENLTQKAENTFGLVSISLYLLMVFLEPTVICGQP